MLTRRELLRKNMHLGAGLVLTPSRFAARAEEPGVEVNDVQSQLNATRVRRILSPSSMDAIHIGLREAEAEAREVSVCGGRHSMGGQQFGADTILIDMRKFNRVIQFDRQRGLIEVEAGIEWPELIAWLQHEQRGAEKQWGIREKQTGVDRVSIGGSLSSNIHGRGLRFPPIIGDIESFNLVDAGGQTSHLQPQGKPRSLRARHWRVWTFRPHH